MQSISSTLFAVMLSLVGPAPSDSPKAIELSTGDKIVAIGDSITSQAGYIHDIDAVLAQEYPDLKIPKIVNKGISGQVAEDLIKRFDRDVIQQKPAFVTISIGINDVWHRLKVDAATGKPLIENPDVLANYKKNVGEMVDRSQSAGIKVILLTPTLIQESADSPGNTHLVQFVAAEKEIAADKHCQLVDLHQMFLDLLPKKPAGDKGNWLTRDGVHPKDTGAAVMAIGVLRALGVPDDKITAVEPPKMSLPRPRTSATTTMPSKPN